MTSSPISHSAKKIFGAYQPFISHKQTFHYVIAINVIQLMAYLHYYICQANLHGNVCIVGDFDHFCLFNGASVNRPIMNGSIELASLAVSVVIAFSKKNKFWMLKILSSCPHGYKERIIAQLNSI